jgi:hypothetical protein
MVHDHVARLGLERDELVLPAVDVGHDVALGPWDRHRRHEQVRSEHAVPPMGAPHVHHGTGLTGDVVQRAPGGAQLGTFDVEVAQVLVPFGSLGGARLLDQDRILVEPQARRPEQLGDHRRER